MTFIFGTLSNDELKLVRHRAGGRGVQHQRLIHPFDPTPDDSVTIEATTDEGLGATHAAIYYTTDGSDPHGERETVLNGDMVFMQPGEVTWDTFSWSYLTRWRGVLPPQSDGTTVRYRIGAWADGEAQAFADYPDRQRTVEQAAHFYFRQEPIPPFLNGNAPGSPDGEIFAYRVDTLRPSSWAKDAVIYHVFVDRFSPGSGRDWLQTDDLNGICGGTFDGIIEKLDYIQELGANCLWLSPIWDAPSHHGYDVTDYCSVNPRMGGEASLRRLIAMAHGRGMRIIFDLVCNHISNEHPLFLSAKREPKSPYRDWFIFNDSPIGYETFFNVATMPKVNLANPAAAQWMIDIALYWLTEFGVDGYRLDYAQGPVPEFWWDFRAACRAASADCFLFGEIIEPPDDVRIYQGRLDGCLDFVTAQAIRQTYAYGRENETRLNHLIAAQSAYYQPDFILPTFIDNHDMDRFLFAANGDKEALKRAAAVQMALPNPPIIYYGTEVGLSQPAPTRGYGLHMCRTPMLWGDEQDRDLYAYYQALIAARRE